MSDYYCPLKTMLWVLFLCMLQSMFYMTACGCVAEERAALKQIRSSLMGLSHRLHWEQSGDCCSWNRVVCNNDSARVSELHLSGPSSNPGLCAWNLNLTIFSPLRELQLLDVSWNRVCLQNLDGLQGLTKLRYLNFSGNGFSESDVTESLSKFASLEVLNLVYTDIGGPLQNIAFRNLKELRELHLYCTQLNGIIPSSLFELSHLKYLDLSGNQLDGRIPAFLFELPHLEYLDLSDNFLLQGHIPIGSHSNVSTSLKSLKLSGNNLEGTFDFFWLRNCTMLKTIDLSWNFGLSVRLKFRGLVSPFQLRTLILSGCNLDKNILAEPDFLVTQRHLRIIDLSSNNLKGGFPSWILGNETSLVYLDLSNNSLEGSLDLMWQHRCSNLQMIRISSNHFVGQLPTNISSVFPNLEVLGASDNNIYGDLPPSLCSIRSMKLMDLSYNKVGGEVPACLFTDFPMLEFLVLSNNNLGGPIFGGASNLSVTGIYIDSNKFEGTLPKNLSGNTAILDLHHNRLSGKLSASSLSLPSLVAMNIASNSLSGEIDPAICRLTGLQVLDLSDNSFTGPLPNCRRKLALTFLNMSRNSMSGSPGDFIGGSPISALDLTYNQFSGTLDWMQRLTQIRLLLLGGNRFEGQISQNLCHLQDLNILDLSHNRLSGALPPCVGVISFGYYPSDIDSYLSVYLPASKAGYMFDMGSEDASMVSDGDVYDIQGFTFFTKGNLYTYGRDFFDTMFGINLSGNKFSGEIPQEIGHLSHLKSLNLSGNLFSGGIPATIANMSALESLDLSHNELSGPIPWQLAQLWSLEVFSVAYNNLSGCIPSSGQFGSFSVESYHGNKNLENMSSPGNNRAGCSAGSSGIAPAVVPEDAPDDPVLYVVSAASFVLALWATVAFSFCHSYGRCVMLNL